MTDCRGGYFFQKEEKRDEKMRVAYTINVGCSSVVLVLVIKISAGFPSPAAPINNVSEFVLISAALGTYSHRFDNVIFSPIPFR
jgi:hypothetical protein